MKLFDLLVRGQAWIAGNEDVLHRFHLSLMNMTVAEAEALPRNRVDAGTDGEEDPYYDHSATYEVVDNVAVIGIKGMLVNSDRWYLKYLGMCGYPHIIDQCERARQDPNVTAVVFDFATPGGQANGISQAAEAIRLLASEKPVKGYATEACSGGLWLASAAGKLVIDKMAMTGSLGVIMIHTDYSGYYKEMGIKHTVIRKGKYKCLVTGVEPLSEEAKAEIERNQDFIYGFFVEDVANGFGLPKAFVESDLGDGAVWLGEEAIPLGVATEVGTLTDLVAKSAKLTENRFNRFRLSSGTGETDMNVNEQADKDAKDNAAAATDAGQVADTGTDGQQAAASAATTTEQATADTALVTELRSQLAAKDTDLVNARVEVAAKDAQLAQAGNTIQAMEGIVRASLNRMNVAMGQAASDYASVTGSVLVSQHVEAEKQFAARFPTGGVAAVQTENDDQKVAAAGLNPAEAAAHAARVRATMGRSS